MADEKQVIMIVKQAKDVARQWVTEQARNLPGFVGAYLAGSVNWLPDEAPLPATSDVDLMVVLAGPDPPGKPGKFIYRGLLLEVTYLAAERMGSPERVLADYHLASSFSRPGVIADPSGRLTELQAQVSRAFAQRPWVRRRAAGARDKVLRNLQRLNASEPFHDQVLTWLFPTGVMAQVLLVAGLRNPTVRRRYVAARELLADYDRLDFYEILLEPLGCAGMERERVEHHLATLAEAFDGTKGIGDSPFFFASDISDVARPLAIDGSRELIARGYHREAIFWIVVTYSRCQKIRLHAAPLELQERYTPGYRRLLGDLGITSFADLERRSAQVKQLLPRVWEVAEEVMGRHPEIKDGPPQASG